jgi:hypothetical protein
MTRRIRSNMYSIILLMRSVLPPFSSSIMSISYGATVIGVNGMV